MGDGAGVTTSNGMAPDTKTGDYLYALHCGAAPMDVMAQSNARIDPVWRGFLDACFNPLRQYGRYGRAATIPPVDREIEAEEINDALRAEWFGWKEVLTAVESGESDDNALIQFSGSGAWPVFARILRKKCPGLSADEANVYGWWRPWEIGKLTVGGDVFCPAAIEPIPHGRRRLAIIRRGSMGKVDVLCGDGTLMPEPHPIFDTLAGLRTYVSGGWFEGGLVLDGIFHPITVDAEEEESYTVFDALPLLKFATGDQHGTYEARRKLMNALATRSEELAIPFRLVPSISCASPSEFPSAISKISSHLSCPVRGWVAKPLTGGYPYGRSDDWVGLP
jgi:hypothetical protein